MSYSSGTASGFGDLMDRLRSFMAGGPGWTVDRYIAAGPVGGGAYVASSQFDANNSPGKAFDGVATGDVGWLTFGGLATPSWVQIEFDAEIHVRKWAITARSANLTRAPKDFALERWNGSSWVSVQSVTGATGWTANQRREYTNSGSSTSRFWRIYITANDGDASYTGLAEIEMYDETASTDNLAISSRVPELIMHGPGLSASDEIYTGLRRNCSRGADYWNWQINGMIGYVSANSYATQPGVSPTKSMLLTSDNIPYWMVGNGRRWIVAAKIGTQYEIAHGGLILPYATPSQYPYPLLVGGTVNGATTARWSDTGAGHTNFANTASSGCLRSVAGSWMAGYDIWPQAVAGITAYNYRNTPSNDYPLLPIEINDAGPNRYGYLDGLFFAPGYSAAAEDVIQVGGTDYLMIPNVFRSGVRDFVALKLA